MNRNILAIETSCDETAVSIVQDGKTVLSNVVATQIDVHQAYGGVVPEIASRRHLNNILPVYLEAMKNSGLTMNNLDAIAVTNGPGLIGSLLTGLSFAKALAFSYDLPLIAVNHIVSHLYAAFIDNEDIELPLIALIVSGGHTQIVYLEEHLQGRILGKTRDDAAGEAFDKIARRLGLGYPGGPEIQKIANSGKKDAFVFPVAFANEDTLEFSFSGLKSSVINVIHNYEQKNEQVPVADIARGFQGAVVEALVGNTLKAVEKIPVKNVILAGGVAANLMLREELQAGLDKMGVKLHYPNIKYCTDNAAMVGAAAYHYYGSGKFADLGTDAYSHNNEGEVFESVD
jgi:N6-L-threonylcarbamoyladenine synthase